LELSHKVHAASRSAIGSLLKPLHGLSIVAVRPKPGLKQVAGAALRLNMALFGRLSVPIERTGIVLIDADAVAEHPAEISLSLAIPLPCQGRKFIKPPTLPVVYLNEIK
jgi:hypothetical protein